MNTVDGSSAVGLSGGGAILAVSQASKAKVRIRYGVITPALLHLMHSLRFLIAPGLLLCCLVVR